MKVLTALCLMLALLAIGNSVSAACPFGVCMGDPIKPDKGWGPKGYGSQALEYKGATPLDFVVKEGTREHGTCMVWAAHYYTNEDQAESAFVQAFSAFKIRYGFDPKQAIRFTTGIVWSVSSNPDKIASIRLEAQQDNTTIPWVVVSRFFFENADECAQVESADAAERRKIKRRQEDLERKACHRIKQWKGGHLYSCSREEIEEEIKRIQAMEDEACVKLLQGRSGTCSREDIKKAIKRMEDIEKEACDRVRNKKRETPPYPCSKLPKGEIEKEIKRMQAMEDEVCVRLLQGRSGTCSREEIKKEIRRMEDIEKEAKETLANETCTRLLQRRLGKCSYEAVEKEIKRMQAMEDEVCDKLLQGESGACSREDIKKAIKRIQDIEKEAKETLLREIILRIFPETRETPIRCYKYARFLSSVFKEFDSLGSYPSQVYHINVYESNFKDCRSAVKKHCRKGASFYYSNIYASGLDVYISCP